MTPKERFGSIENGSLIRKFTVLFIVMSLLPFIIIVYLFVQYDNTGKISLDKHAFLLLVFLVGPGALAGFYGMRRSIVKIQKIIRQTSSELGKSIPGLPNLVKGEDSELSQLSRTFSEVTRNLETNIKRLEASKQTMQYVLSKLAVGISSLRTIDTFLDLIVEITANALDARFSVLMLLDAEKQELYLKSVNGMLSAEYGNLRFKVGEDGPGWVVKHKKPLLVPALHKSKDTDSQSKDLFEPPFLCAPMIYHDKIIGVLSVSGKYSGSSFEEDELLIIANLASQTAIAVENDRLNLDAEKTYLETVSALAMAVEARDPYSRGHSDRVSQYSVKVAEKLGLSAEVIKDIKDAAALHDVGKIGISDEILKKDTALSAEEEGIMRKHPVIGEGIVRPLRSLASLCAVIRGHHEWFDGSGYPDKLKGEEIPLGAKILAVTDTFDAMTTDRPYRRALSVEAAKEDLKKYIGIRYDKNVVEALLEVLQQDAVTVK